MANLTSTKILKKIGEPFLKLYRGEGYWYFIYDNGADIYESQSVYCMYLTQQRLEQWVEDGLTFVNEVKQKHGVE